MYAETTQRRSPLMLLIIAVALFALALLALSQFCAPSSSSNYYSLNQYPGSAGEATQWHALGFSPEQAMGAAQRGLTPLEAAEEKAAEEGEE